VDFRFLPNVAKVQTEGKATMADVGAVHIVSYNDVEKTVQHIRVVERSDLKTSVTWVLEESLPPVPVQGATHTITLYRITEPEGQTLVEYHSDYSQDVSNFILVDSKYKKIEFFKQLARAATRRAKNWIPIESDSQLMNKYISSLGVKGDFNFSDVYGTTPDLLAMVPQPVLAVLLLFPISEASEAFRKSQAEEVEKKGQTVSPNVWYIKQTVGNACGTIGLLHAIANNQTKVQLAENKFFANFLRRTRGQTPQQKASALENDTEIEVAHEKTAKEAKSKVDHKINDNLHFNCWVCVDGGLYELDGRKRFPIYHGPTTQANLLSNACRLIRTQFMDRAPADLRFNMVALARKDDS